MLVADGGKVWHDTTKYFQPRLGFAYRLGANTVIRASFGIFFDNYSGVTQIARNFIKHISRSIQPEHFSGDPNWKTAYSIQWKLRLPTS